MHNLDSLNSPCIDYQIIKILIYFLSITPGALNSNQNILMVLQTQNLYVIYLKGQFHKVFLIYLLN